MHHGDGLDHPFEMSSRRSPSSSLPDTPDDRQNTARPAKLRLVLIGILVVLLCIGGFTWRGHGYRTRFVRWITGAKMPVPRKDIVLASVAQGAPDPTIRFEKVMLPSAAGAGYTCVQVGPDHRLYAGCDDGRIFRFEIRQDGTLAEPVVFTSLQQAEGG